MQIWIKRIVILAVVVGVLAGGFALFKQGAGAGKKEETTYEQSPVERTDVVSFVSATGTVQPWKIVDVRSNVGGEIKKLTVDIGDRVAAGQLVMAIDPTDPLAEKATATANLDAAEARLMQASLTKEQQRLQAEARIAGSRKAITGSEARLAQALANREVQPALVRLGIAQAQAQLESAQKSVLQSQQAKGQLEQQLSTLQEVTIPLNVESVDAGVQQAKAGVQTAQAEFGRQRTLFVQGFVARSDVEAVYNRVETAKATQRTAEQRRKTIERENSLSIKELQARIDGAQSSIEEGQARIRQATATLDVAKENAVQTRVREAEYNAAAANLEQARQDLRLSQADLQNIKLRQQDEVSARATIVSNTANLKRANTNLGFTKVIAPRSGIIITKNVEEGTVIPSSRGSIGSTNSLLQIGDTSRLWIVTNVDETDISNVRVNQLVRVRVDAYPDLKVAGRVIRINPQAVVNQNVTNIPVTVELATPLPVFRPGMNATCEFITGRSLKTLAVPNEAIKDRKDGTVVQMLVAGKPQDVKVKPGLVGEETTEIKEGLKEGDQVITRIIEPEKASMSSPFGSPFGGGPRGGGSGGGRGGSGGGGGGPRGGGGR